MSTFEHGTDPERGGHDGTVSPSVYDQPVDNPMTDHHNGHHTETHDHHVDHHSDNEHDLEKTMTGSRSDQDLEKTDSPFDQSRVYLDKPINEMPMDDDSFERHKALEKKPEDGESAERQEFQESDGAPFNWNFNRVVAVIALTLIFNGAQIVLYMTGGALSFIAISIGTTTQQNWLLTANTLANTAACPFVGYLTDLLGRRWIAIFGTCCLVASSIAMAVTDELASALVGQAIGGIGAGICELTALAGVSEITPVKWRGVTVAAVVFAIFPFMPYLIYIEEMQKASSWRWAFLITGGWNAIALVGLFFCYKPPSRHNVDGLTKWQILRRIDWMGAFLSIGGITLFLVGINSGGYQYKWTNAIVLSTLIIGGLMLWVAFPLWEWKFATHPMVPHELFRGQRVVLLAYVIVFIAGMNFYSVLGFFPLILENFYDTTPIEIGYRGLGYTIAFLLGACVSNFAISYTRGHVRWMFLCGAVIMTAFGGALAAATPFNPGTAIAFATLDAFGIGIIIVPSLTLALYACPDAYVGTAAALSLATRFLGGSIGTAIFFNVFYTQMKTNLKQVAATAVQAGLPESAAETFVQALQAPMNPKEVALAVPGATPEIVETTRLAYRWAYANAMQNVWYATIPFGVLTIIACLWIPNIKKFMTNRVAVDIL